MMPLIWKLLYFIAILVVFPMFWKKKMSIRVIPVEAFTSFRMIYSLWPSIVTRCSAIRFQQVRKAVARHFQLMSKKTTWRNSKHHGSPGSNEFYRRKTACQKFLFGLRVQGLLKTGTLWCLEKFKLMFF